MKEDNYNIKPGDPVYADQTGTIERISPTTKEKILEKFREMHEGDWALNGCMTVHGTETIEAISSWLSTSLDTLEKDTREKLRTQIEEKKKSNDYDWENNDNSIPYNQALDDIKALLP